MRRSVAYTEPKKAYAGQVNTWKFVYSPATPLQKGTRFKFDIGSFGRDFEWVIPETGSRKKSNLIWMATNEKKMIPATAVMDDTHHRPLFEFVLPHDLEEGENVCIFMGSPDPATSATQGNRAQTNTVRRKPFYLHIDPKGKGNYKEIEPFYIDVRGGMLKKITPIVPSIVNKNERFNIVIRFEDEYSNLTGLSPEDTLIELSYERLRENINWKLFVPETGFITLPNLYFNEIGLYRIQLKNLRNGSVFFSSPIKCYPNNPLQAYWGTFHAESTMFDSSKNIESSLRFNRDDKSLQFFSTSAFESEEETPGTTWKNISTFISEFNEDDRSVAFLGCQWQGEDKEEGLRQIVYAKDGKPILRKNEQKSSHLKKIYRNHLPKELLSIPMFTMGSKTVYDFQSFDPEYEKAVEIYNAWGSSECTASEGNPRPISCKSKKGMKEKAEGSIRRALNKNCRFAFLAGGYDDRGAFKDFFDSDQVQYTPGITAILSSAQTRDGLLQAIEKRSTFATTGPRILVDFSIANQPIGSQISTADKPGLAYNRHIKIDIVGTDKLKEVLVIRNGEVFLRFAPDSEEFELEHDDLSPIAENILKGPDGSLFQYFYLRVEQEDSHLAWSSPIWIDHSTNKIKKEVKK